MAKPRSHEHQRALAVGEGADHFGPASDFPDNPCQGLLVRMCRIRLESVLSAIEQARVVTANILGKPKDYDAVPWFWHDQYDLKLQMVGLSQGYESIAIRSDPAQRSSMALYLREGRVIAVDAISRPAEFITAKKLVAMRVGASAERLADESQPLKALLGV